MSEPARLAGRIQEILKTARELGLDFFPIEFELVPFEMMTELAAYGLPTRAQHWSYGKVYARQNLHGRMGLAKIFEIVVNGDPAYAFLLDTNSEVENLLIAAHVAAHVDFFKHNICFAPTNRRMVSEAGEHARRFEAYRERFGDERVERLMDIGFALDRHIDPFKGLYRKPYPDRRRVWRRVREDAYDDLFGERPFSLREEVSGERFPPHPEKDLLWFLIQYAPLDDWERDVLAMIREESYYFYPQFITKVLNEGWASFWHAEIIGAYTGISPAEMLDFSRLHAQVVNPGPPLQINPYYLGYRILAAAEKAHGREHLFRIRSEEDDFSFIRNYLTPELCEELELFRYGRGCERHPEQFHPSCPDCRTKVVIRSRDVDDIREGLLRDRYHYGVPNVVIDRVKHGVLHLEQLDRQERGLDRDYAEKTLAYLHELWKGPVRILTRSPIGHRDVVWVYDRGRLEEVSPSAAE